MARPKADFPAAEAISALADKEGRLAIRVTPGSRSEAIRIDGNQLGVKVRAKPQDGAANDAVIRLLSKALNIAPSQITMLRGATSRDKLIRISRG